MCDINYFCYSSTKKSNHLMDFMVKNNAKFKGTDLLLF